MQDATDALVPQHPELAALFRGDSEMARRMREFDWSASPLGPPEQWPQSLKTVVGLCLASRFPILLWWGPQLVELYNDAYRPVLGDTKHPGALGVPGQQIWPEIWPIISPMLESVMARGDATLEWDQLLFLDRRRGYLEECYFVYAYSPIRDESGGVGGVFSNVFEVSDRVIGERRLRVLRDLAAQTSGTGDVPSACARLADVLGRHRADVPFACLYLIDEAAGSARLGCSSGEPGADAAPPCIALDDPHAAWPLAEALAAGSALQVDGLPERLQAIASGPWPDAVQRALVLPVRAPGQAQTVALLVAGVSTRRDLDAAYRDFFDLVARQVAASLADAQAFEAARQRAEALAEIDRAKTAFFTNVSHEFRTPLTLMLGPIEDLQDGEATAAQREQLGAVQRNAERLLKLVNTLLDFARVEGGRADARFEPTDLSACTAELASNFRSACERAGLALHVECPPLPEPVYVDRDLWEKVVLNLLSNAFKFTLEGAITVSLRHDAEGVELRVQDTGTGMAADDLPLLFQRFSRIAASRGRSFEGSGIGLALVHELVRLHGGSIRAESQPGQGSCFIVNLRFGRAHLPADRVGNSMPASARQPTAARAFVSEALQWLPAPASLPDAESGFTALDGKLGEAVQPGARVLVADDNADLRAYLKRLLGAHYAVQVVADGNAAVEAALIDPPDLVLSDVMMPGLDGFGVVARLRADPRTRTIPVILLSARAGDEARVEGLQAGADDYLVKPFSARELLARVAAHLSAARIRREAGDALRESEEKLRAALAAARGGAWEMVPSTGAALWSPELYRLFGVDATLPASTAAAVERMHPDDRERLMPQMLAQMERSGDVDVEFRLMHPQLGERWFHAIGRRVEPDRVIGITRDVTERKRIEQAARESESRLELALQAGLMGTFEVDIATGTVHSSALHKAMYGLPADAQMSNEIIKTLVHPDDLQRAGETVIASSRRGEDFAVEYRTVWPDASVHWLVARGRTLHDGDGRALRRVGVTVDVTASRHAQQDIERLNQALGGKVEELQSVVTDLTLLHEQATRLTAGLDRQAVLDEMLRAALGLTGSTHGMLTLVDTPNDDLELVASAGFSQDYLELVQRVPRGAGSCGTCFTRRQRVIVEDTDSDPIFAPYREAARVGGYRSAHSTPLLAADGSVLGVLTQFAPQPGRPSERQMRLTDLLTRYAGGYIEHLRLVEALRDADRRKDEFLATLAHELRNPLAPIRNALHLLRRGANPADAAGDKLHAILERQVNHMVRLVDDLMEVSRISRGAIELQRETLDLAGVILAAVDSSRPLIDANDHLLDMALPNEALLVEGDAVRLTQVFANLLNNAARYTERGGQLRVVVAREAGDVRVTVQDSGIGIAADELPLLFEMFSQVDARSSRSQGGLGIGLHLVQQLVRLHGGSVHAASDGVGCGASFTVRLPLSATNAATDAATELQAEPAHTLPVKRRVLVIDDNRDAGDSLGLVIEAIGAEVRVAYDGAMALDALNEGFDPALVLLDLGMPGMDGYEVARRIRAEPRFAALALIALTGWGQSEDRERSRAAGFDQHLTKPVDMRQLQGLLVVAAAGR